MKLFTTYIQASPYDSPWGFKTKVKILLWEICWNFFCSWTPKPFNRWRIMWLRFFGTKINGTPFVHQRAKISIPWNLTLWHRSCVGDGAIVYSLGEIELMDHSTVAQEAYLCAGTHDFSQAERPLMTGKILIGRSAFIGARAFIMPSVCIGEGSVVGACSVVTKDVGPYVVVGGNPARILKVASLSY